MTTEGRNIEEYLRTVKAMVDTLTEQVGPFINHLFQAYLEDRTVFLIGNGGSAANSSHFATDLGKGASDKAIKRFRCLALNDNVREQRN